MQEIWNSLVAGVRDTTPGEAVAAIAGIISVIYSMLRKVYVYPFGLISICLYIYITFQFGLYADFGVQIYYFIMSIYGWYYWQTSARDQTGIYVSVNSKRENLISVMICVLSFAIISQVLIYFTNSTVPYWDATTTAIAITGMWLMARKKIENWIAWILTDAISVPLYFSKGLVFSSFQYVVFTLFAVIGYITWLNALKRQKAELVT